MHPRPDKIWFSRLKTMGGELATDCLPYRYDPSASPDGLVGNEGTFSLCTFNYVDAPARAGQLEGARLTIEKMLTNANHVGLYAEEIGLTGEQLPPGVHSPGTDRRRDHPGLGDGKTARSMTRATNILLPRNRKPGGALGRL
jgi:hypothetical protein